MAAEFLFSRYLVDGVCDLSHVLVVVSGGRAGRRLLELLVLRSEQADASGERTLLSPPRIVTPGRLPELLYVAERPIASELEGVLARCEVLRRAPSESLRELFPVPPAPEDVLGWMRLADEVAQMDQELAGEAVGYADVERYCVQRHLQASSERWRALAELQGAYRQALKEVGRSCKLEAREEAVSRGFSAEQQSVVLVAAPDLPVTTRELLRASGASTTVLVHAPESEADGFDDFGILCTSYWQGRTVPLEDDDVCIVDHPRDQILAVTETICAVPGLKAEHVTVGLGDDMLGAGVQRALRLKDRASHRAVSCTLSESAPALLLSVLATYSDSACADRLAVLVRHPDLAQWLQRQAGVNGDALPEECDRFRNERLPYAIDRNAARLPDGLGKAIAAINGLLAEFAKGRRRLCDWADPLAQLLARIYDAVPAANAAHTPTARALEAFGHALESIRSLDGSLPFVPVCNFSDAVGLILSRFGSEPLPELTDGPAIDILGWLEIHLDDAPILVLAGFNEGLIPESAGAASFLPDGLRREMGLLDNGRRYARDAYVLHAVKHSRQSATFVSGRRTSQNEPLSPSRLFFACAPEKVAQRALAFYGPEPEASTPPMLLPHSDSYELAQVPRPRPLAEPLAKVRVTAFKDYISCPYRFYLKHVLKLGAEDDTAVEMGGALFGNLAHEVLKSFGLWVMEQGGQPPYEASAIRHFLDAALDAEAAKQFGTSVVPVVKLQLNQLRRRLHTFADWQAEDAQSGWKIAHIEADVERAIALDAASFTVFGRLDRIDQHAGTGKYRVLDYKTSDGGDAPKKTHLANKEWKDLQLPLYRRLAPALGLNEEDLEVGYIVLPGKADRASLMMAGWGEEEFEAAYRSTDDILRKLRDGVFWPPSDTPPRFEDGLGAICQDASLDRVAILAKENGSSLHWPHGPHAFAPEVAYAH